MKRLGKLEGKTIVSNKESKLRINEIELDSLGGGDDSSSGGGASGLDMSNFVKFFLIKNGYVTKDEGMIIYYESDTVFRVCNTDNQNGASYNINYSKLLYSRFGYEGYDYIYAYKKTSKVWCNALIEGGTDEGVDETLVAIIDLDGRYTTIQQSVDFINANADKYAWAIEAMQKFKDALTTGAFTTTEA